MKIKITETILRDAHQSLIATRMTTKEMLPILKTLDEVGYYSLECWGGATFDACLRYLDEDPWERLRTIKRHVKNTKLQMLLRGQNLLGYRHYADDVVEAFVHKAVKNGIDIVRIFDAFNDLRNIESALRATKKAGAEAQVAISYTIGDAYTLDYWKKVAKEIEEMGADSICIKDMAGLLLPQVVATLIETIKSQVKIPVYLHSHCTSGVAPITYAKAIEAGVNGLDTALSPFSNGTSQPATEVLNKTFEGSEYDFDLNDAKLLEAAEYFKTIREKYTSNGILDPKALETDINTLIYQVPGGMISNLISQLREQNAEEKFYDVLKEIPKVRKELGDPPLVTPSSQIVGTQSVLNVLMKERYKVITEETKKIFRGEYGKTIGEFDKEIQKKVIGNEQGIVCRPADLIGPEMETLKKEMEAFYEQEEDVLTYALFPKLAMEYFKRRDAEKSIIDLGLYDLKNKGYPV